MVSDDAPRVHVADGDEVAAAAVRRRGDVRVDQHHGNLRVPEDAYDLLVRIDHLLRDERTEDHAFRAADRKLAHLASDVAHQRFAPAFAREDERNAVSEARGVTLGLLLYLGEELVRLVVRDD